MQIVDRKFLNVTTPTCHASTIAFFQDKPVYAWFGGTREGLPDSAIYIQSGEKIATIGSEDAIPRWNPILFPSQLTNQLFLFVKAGAFCDRWSTFLYNISGIFDDDFDINKIRPQIIPAGVNGPVKTKCVEKNGFIYCGSSFETMIDWSSFIEKWSYDEDLGIVFYNRTSPLTVNKRVYSDPYGAKRLSLGIIQPSLWIDQNGDMNAFFRSSRGLGKIYHSVSTDKKNEVWRYPKPTKFDNPNSGIDTVYVNKKLFLVHNPSDTNRYPLVLSELDDKMSIQDEITITEEITLGETSYSNELSYPYIVYHKGQLHMVYTWGRSKIERVTISI